MSVRCSEIYECDPAPPLGNRFRDKDRIIRAQICRIPRTIENGSSAGGRHKYVRLTWLVALRIWGRYPKGAELEDRP